MVEKIEGLRGLNVTFDNFFMSPELSQALLKRKITMLGTVGWKKPERSPAIVATKGKRHYIFKVCLRATSVSWK